MTFSSVDHAEEIPSPQFDLDEGWEQVLRDAGMLWKARLRRLRRFVRPRRASP